MTDEEKSKNFRKIGLLQFTRYCVEKILANISDRGEKRQLSSMSMIQGLW